MAVKLREQLYHLHMLHTCTYIKNFFERVQESTRMHELSRFKLDTRINF